MIYIPDKAILLEKIAGILNSGWLVEGEYNTSLESKVKQMTGAEYACSCSSCTSGLELILRALPDNGKKKVILPVNTFFATVVSVINAGYTPVFADVNSETGMLDWYGELYPMMSGNPLNILQTNIDEIAAIIFVSIGGWISKDYIISEEWCKELNIPLIGDMAHGHYSSILSEGKLRVAGNIGTASAFSYFPSKVVFGAEGGIVTTNDGELADRINKLKSLGKAELGWANYHTDIGIHARMSNISACICDHMQERAASLIKQRIKYANEYNYILSKDLDDYFEMHSTYGCGPNYYKYIIREKIAGSCNSLSAFLASKHIGVPEKVFGVGLHQQPVIKKLYPQSRDFRGFTEFSKAHMCLPMSHKIDNFEYVCEQLIEWRKQQ